jgi:hypothetical protein
MAYGIPSLVSHVHEQNTNKWSAGSLTDGEIAHNHREARHFGGGGSSYDDREPYTAGMCWDGPFLRTDLLGRFDKGHCYVDEGLLSTATPKFEFVGSWNSSAKARVKDAFQAYDYVFTDTTDLNTGVDISEESGTGTADFEVHWTSGFGGVGQWAHWENPPKLKFNNTLSYDFGKDTSGVPDDKYHFFSIALHEVGHVHGLLHQADTNDVMNENTAGAPKNSGGVHFSTLDFDSNTGIRELYSQPRASQANIENACTITKNFIGCPGGSPRYVITVNNTSGSSGPTLIDVDYKLPWTNWSDLADIISGCVGHTATLGVQNFARAFIQTELGLGYCELQYNVPSNQCNSNPL